MSTRSTTHFIEGDREVAILYRHADGYPEGHGRDLQRFFTDVEAQAQDTRYNDPSYLAAKLVVWLAREFASEFKRDETTGDYAMVSHANDRPLDFLSVGIVLEDPGDIEFIYTVDCSTFDVATKRPLVTCFEAEGKYDEPVRRGRVVPIPAEGAEGVEVAA